jgi:hypothetical protein
VYKKKVRNTLKMFWIALLGIILLFAYSSSSGVAQNEKITMLQVDLKRYPLRDMVESTRTAYPILQTQGRVWIAINLIHLTIEPVQQDPIWNMFYIRGISFKLGSPEMHTFQLPSMPDALSEMNGMDLPVAPMKLSVSYVPLVAVMKALGHAVEIKSSVVYIVRGGSPKTLVPGIKPFQKPK